MILSRLVKRICYSLPYSIKIQAWCDSTIVWSWLSQPHLRLETFQVNRTSQILENLPRKFWDHVAFKENPVDCISGGIPALKLLNFELWWKGAKWLSDNLKYNSKINNSNNFDIVTYLETFNASKSTCSAMVSTVEDCISIESIIIRISKWMKLVRVVVYMLKFIYKAKHQRSP